MFLGGGGGSLQARHPSTLHGPNVGSVRPYSQEIPVQGCLAHEEGHPLGPYSTPIYRPTVVLPGRGGLVMSEVPQYPPRPERAPRPVSIRVEEWLQCDEIEVMPRRYVASRPPSDMPSTPAALASPLTSAED